MLCSVFFPEHVYFARVLMSVMAFIYIILCLITGFAGRNRSAGFIGFAILSLLFTPFLIWIVLLLTDPKAIESK